MDMTETTQSFKSWLITGLPAMIKSKELLPLTGYIHGGCSPIGMKKLFKTTIDSSVEKVEKFCVSGGKIGYQVEITLEDLRKVIPVQTAEITV